MSKKDCLDKHVYIRPDDWHYINNIMDNDASLNSFTDGLHHLVMIAKSDKKDDEILENLNGIKRQIGGMSKDVMMGNHMLGELFYINELQYVRHGITPEIKKSAMKLVDNDIKNYQERKTKWQN